METLVAAELKSCNEAELLIIFLEGMMGSCQRVNHLSFFLSLMVAEDEL